MTRAISERELSADSDVFLDAVEHGEAFIVTRDARAVAVLGPIAGSRHVGVPLDVIRARFAGLPSMDYAAMRAEIDEFFGDDDRIHPEDYE